MSRIGQKIISIPVGVEVTWNAPTLTVRGPKGTLNRAIPENLAIVVDKTQVVVKIKEGPVGLGSIHGLYRSLVANMIEGVAKGYTKNLEIQGVGFKASVQGRKVVFTLGYSHPVEMSIPDSVEIKVTDNVNVSVSGPDKQQIGDLAAQIKSYYPAEPYKGKGVRFKGEYIRRKVGKTVA